MNATEAAEAMAEEAHAQAKAEIPPRQERVLYSHRGDAHRWELVLEYTPAGHRYWSGGEPSGVDCLVLRDREWFGTTRANERLQREQTVILTRDDLLKLVRVAKVTPDELKAVIRGW